MQPANPGQAEVGRLFPQFAVSPALHVMQIDAVRQSAFVMKMAPEDYRRASFLNPDIVTPQTLGAHIPLFRVIEAAEAQPEPRPAPHFIFHQGHTGSTLISRLLEETGKAFALREPWPLLSLAELHDRLGAADSLVSETEYARLRNALLTLWARTFDPARIPLVKATSHGGRLAGDLMGAAPGARAVTLHLKPESYLATLLAGENSAADLRGFAQERMRRLNRLFGDISAPVHALSAGELAALSWLTERASQSALAAEGLDERRLDVDFESFLETPGDWLHRMSEHFGMAAPLEAAEQAVQGPVMTRYSKATSERYSPELRRQRLDHARRAHADEIRRGLNWLEAAATKDQAAARVIGG